MQRNSRPGLPGTPTDSSTPSTPDDALVARIASRIAAAGGWMPFDDFMAEALYAPGLGYYSGGRRIFGLGPEGGSDFVTAPELSPFFGRALAVQVREALTASGSERVYEFGAGTGALAEQLLEALDADDADDDGMLRVPVDYTIIELSGPAARAPAGAPRALRAARAAGWTPGPRRSRAWSSATRCSTRCPSSCCTARAGAGTSAASSTCTIRHRPRAPCDPANDGSHRFAFADLDAPVLARRRDAGRGRR